MIDNQKSNRLQVNALNSAKKYTIENMARAHIAVLKDDRI